MDYIHRRGAQFALAPCKTAEPQYGVGSVECIAAPAFSQSGADDIQISAILEQVHAKQINLA